MTETTIQKHWFNKTINFYCKKMWRRTIGAVLDIKLSRIKFFRLKIEVMFNIRNFLQFGLLFMARGLEINLPFLSIDIYLKDKDIIPPDYLNFIMEECEPDDFARFQVDSGTMVVEDNEPESYEDNSKCYPDCYRDFYISKYLKIYTKHLLDKDGERVLELALPNLYYFTAEYSKSYEILGFGVNLTGNPFFELYVLSKKLRLSVAKNHLARRANLFSCKAIDRYFELKGNKKNPKDYEIEYRCFNILVKYNKYAQFKHLMKYLNVEKFMKYPGNWHFGRNIYSSRGLDLFIADLGIKYSIFKNREGLVERDIEGEDKFVQERIKMVQGKRQ